MKFLRKRLMRSLNNSWLAELPWTLQISVFPLCPMKELSSMIYKFLLCTKALWLFQSDFLPGNCLLTWMDLLQLKLQSQALWFCSIFTSPKKVAMLWFPKAFHGDSGWCLCPPSLRGLEKLNFSVSLIAPVHFTVGPWGPAEAVVVVVFLREVKLRAGVCTLLKKQKEPQENRATFPLWQSQWVTH